MVAAFAKITGDYNSMHVDPEVARKSKYRRTVVHGMIPYSFIQILQHEFTGHDLTFIRFDGRFRKPVFSGDKINLDIRYEVNDGDGEFDAVWSNQLSGETLIKSKGAFRLTSPYSDEDDVTFSADDKFLSDDIEENQYLISDLSDQNESFGYQLSAASRRRYCDQVLNAGLDADKNISGICNNLSSLLMLSTMVGMRLPGRYAIFTRFSLDFSEDVKVDERYGLAATLTKVSVPAETMEAVVNITSSHVIAEGRVVVLLNPPPRKMISSQEVIDRYRHLGIDGKVVLITGASRGIGETAAKLFAALGARVVINYFRGRRDAEAIVEEILESGGEAICIQCDISDDASTRKMIDAAVAAFGRIDVLVNNAVRDFTPKDIIDMEWEDYMQEMEVSVKGLHSCCRAAIPELRKSGGGKIINLSTVAVDNPVAGQSRYITAKSAVAGYTKSLAKELMKYNIQANLVMPNMTDTDLVSVLPSMYKDKIAESRPCGRHVLPVEVAQSIVFLASSWSDAITGQKIVLNLGEPPFA